MKFIYNNLNIQFIMEHTTISVLNLALERLSVPIPKHSHGSNSYELHYIADGYGIVRIEGNAYEVGPNTFFVTGPNIEHEQIPFFSNPMIEYSVYFKLKNCSDHSGFLSIFAETSFWLGKDTQNMQAVLKRLFAELRNQVTGYTQGAVALLQICIILAVRNYERFPQKEDAMFQPTNLAEQKTFTIERAFLYEYRDLTLEKLANYLGISARQTERFLKEHYNQTFSEKKTEARMSAAAILLKNHELTLLEIAENLGYASIEYFTSKFKKHYHMSPRDYMTE